MATFVLTSRNAYLLETWYREAIIYNIFFQNLSTLYTFLTFKCLVFITNTAKEIIFKGPLFANFFHG